MRNLVWRREKNATNVIIEGGSHLVSLSPTSQASLFVKLCQLSPFVLIFQVTQEKPYDVGEYSLHLDFVLLRISTSSCYSSPRCSRGDVCRLENDIQSHAGVQRFREALDLAFNQYDRFFPLDRISKLSNERHDRLMSWGVKGRGCDLLPHRSHALCHTQQAYDTTIH